MTRDEIALDRLLRHSAFVRDRMEQGIRQAPDDREKARRFARYHRYTSRMMNELEAIRSRIRAAEKARKEREFGQARQQRRRRA